ncbi:MAG: TonB-dependent receptor [Kiritimatiellae bacterium]|nr:TonB-dependent receptor [Kiritimatiellia bacterium]
MNTLMFAAVAAATNAVAQTASAAETNEAAQLAPVVVEATRLGQTKEETPSHVDLIVRSDVESSGAESTVDLLEKRANIFVRKLTPNPAMSQIAMRGYGANSFGRVKVIVDGEELNNPDMAAQELVRVPVRSIEKVEVLHGPQTVLHGGNASAGVVNITSDADSYEKKTTLDVHGGSWGAIGSHVGTRGGFEEAGTTYFADLDFDRADGWRQNSQYELWSLKGGVRQHFGDASWFDARAFYADSRYGMPGGVYYGRSSYGTDYGSWKTSARDASDTEAEARSSVYGLTLSGMGAISDERRIDAAFSFRDRRSTGYTDYDVYTYDWKLAYVDETRLCDFDNRFTVGTDLKYDDLNAESDARNDYARFTGAVFAHDEFWVLEQLSVFGGARGEWFRSSDVYRTASSRDRASRTKGAAAGEAGLNWRPLEGLKLFAKWSHFYHAPLADEMFSYYGVPNMNLRPEEGDDFQLGADWTFLDDFNFNATYYHTELKDEIMYLNYANVNCDDRTARDGFDTSLTWSREKVGSAGVMYSFVRSRFAEGDYKNNYVPLVPGQQLRTYGEVFLVDWIAVGGGFRFVGEQRYGGDFAGRGGMIPNYCLFDAGVRVMPTCGWLDGFTFAFTVDNLFDRRYFDYGEYFDPWYVYPGARRTFMFTVRYEF